MAIFRKRLGEILIEKGFITQEQLLECLDEQKLTREYVGAILIKKKLITEEALMRALSELYGIPHISLKTVYIDWNVCLEFSSLMAANHKVLPIRCDESSLTVAINDPLDLTGVGRLEELVRPKKLKLVLVSNSELNEFIDECKKRSKKSLKDLLDKE